MKKPSFIRTSIALTCLLYISNWLITPLVVSETGLEAKFRPRTSLPYDRATWTNASPSIQHNPSFGKRYEMIDNLMSSGQILGKDRNAVASHLGNPDLTSKDASMIYYVLAPQASYPARSYLFPRVFSNTDRWCLEIKFEKGRVVALRVFAT